LAVEGGVVEGELLGVTLHDRALESGGREVGGGDLDVAGSQVDTGRNRAGAELRRLKRAVARHHERPATTGHRHTLDRHGPR